MGYKPILFVNSQTYQEIDNPKELDLMIQNGMVKQSPPEKDLKKALLEFADKIKAKVISNDSYDNFRNKYDWLSERLIPFMIVDEEIYFYKKSGS